MSDSIKSQLTAAVAARKDSLKQLRARIAEILQPIPVGTILNDESGEVCRVIRACTGASQWGNRRWDVTIKGRAYISDGLLIAEDLDGSYWDGSNNHIRSSEPTCRYAHGQAGEELSWANGSTTRAIALRLPSAISAYMEHCEAERAANVETASTL